jgi:hypothetical protein
LRLHGHEPGTPGKFADVALDQRRIVRPAHPRLHLVEDLLRWDQAIAFDADLKHRLVGCRQRQADDFFVFVFLEEGARVGHSAATASEAALAPNGRRMDRADCRENGSDKPATVERDSHQAEITVKSKVASRARPIRKAAI